MSRAFTAPAFVACAVFLGGCGDLPTRIPQTTSTATQEGGLVIYLDTLNRLANGTPTQQADVFYEVERDYTGAPTTSSTLRYALALVTPGQPAMDLVQGKRLLEQLLANPERLAAAERNLAAFLVKEADARLQLQVENRRLTATVDERARGQANLQSSVDRRVQTLTEDNARLRKALEDAQRKLDALKSIEKSLIERSNPPTNTRDNNREPTQTQSSPASR
ncbi:MAG: hypothetical protein H7Y02_08450 [Candidatus Obscuribacterales bacterium]|nr:hypothetical protein [Steroidobacteraceae bacterium]